MGQNWDAALVIRANELLAEVRRYHVDAEATRLQLASAAALITRKVDDLPASIRQSVEESLQQDTFNAERPIIAKRLDLSTRMLNDLTTQLHASGLSFLRYTRRASTLILLAGVAAGAITTWWASVNYAEVVRLSAQITMLRQTVDQLERTGGRAVVRTCSDTAGRSRICVRVDESAGKFKDSYYAIAR
jgi:hypothetical protein